MVPLDFLVATEVEGRHERTEEDGVEEGQDGEDEAHLSKTCLTYHLLEQHLSEGIVARVEY